MESPVIIENSVNYDFPANKNESGFPFDDTDYDSNDRLQSTLHNIAQRHPEFADQLNFDNLPSWRRKRHGSGSSTERDEPRVHTSGHTFRNFDTGFSDNFPSGFNRFPFTSQFDNLSDDIRTEEKPPEVPRPHEKRGRKINPNLPQHLSNTVDLGQKQAPFEENRGQRSMSAPPENRTHETSKYNTDSQRNMGGMFPKANKLQNEQNTQQKTKPVERVIPIQVEGRDEPLIPKNVHIETENKCFTQGQNQYHVPPGWQNIPNQHTSQFTRQANPTQKTVPTHQPVQTEPLEPQNEPKPNLNDPLEKIKSVKADVLDLILKVETFKGTRKDKDYMYLDEMLTRNLLKLDNIETEGKDNIRTARREAIKCIQECINKLEAKAQLCESQDSLGHSVPEAVAEQKIENPPKQIFKSEAKIEIKTPEIISENVVSEMEYDNVNVKTESQQIEGNLTSHEEAKMEVCEETTNENQETPSDVIDKSNIENSSQSANEINKC